MGNVVAGSLTHMVMDRSVPVATDAWRTNIILIAFIIRPNMSKIYLELFFQFYVVFQTFSPIKVSQLTNELILFVACVPVSVELEMKIFT